MTETIADPRSQSCYLLFSRPGIEEYQTLAPDLALHRARDAHGRFAKGSSGNPRGRPRGIPNPKRRVPDLVARPLSAAALLELLDRKPHLLRPLAVQLLPPPLAAVDPAQRLGLDLSSLRTVKDFRRILTVVLAAVARGAIAPAEAARLARRGVPRWVWSGALHDWRRFTHDRVRSGRPVRVWSRAPSSAPLSTTAGRRS